MPQANPSGGANSERLENVTFPQARIDINDNLEALQTLNSGNSEPSTKAAFMQWLDTSSDPAILKVRNSTNQSWIEIGALGASSYQNKGLTEIVNGGTGQTTAAAAIAALLPGQSGNSGKSLITNGSVLSWAQTISSSFSRFDYTGSNQTWIKPGTGTIVVILCWGGGGGGGSDHSSDDGGGGGGGGACGLLIKPLSELTDSSYTVYVAAGGAQLSGDGNGNNGGNSTVSGSGQGTIVTGWGGQGGIRGSSWGGNGWGGHGGGNTRNGSSHYGAVDVGSNSDNQDWLNGRLGAIQDGAGAGGFYNYSNTSFQSGLNPNALPTGSVFGGGGGGNAKYNGVSTPRYSYNYGASSVFGGGGGGGSNENGNNWSEALGGTSQLGGNGGRGGGSSGGTATAGSVPGGGGGGNEGGGKAGGHGRVEIYVF